MSEEEKTAKEWFESVLDKDLRTKLLTHCHGVGHPDYNRRYRTLPTAIMTSFAWGRTPEGYDYWSEVRNRARGGKIPIGKLGPDLDVLRKVMAL